MKSTKFTVWTLLLMPVLFSLLNGCDSDIDEEKESSKILIVDLEEELAIAKASKITDIKCHGTWMVVSNPFEIQIYHIHT